MDLAAFRSQGWSWPEVGDRRWLATPITSHATNGLANSTAWECLFKTADLEFAAASAIDRAAIHAQSPAEEIGHRGGEGGRASLTIADICSHGRPR